MGYIHEEQYTRGYVTLEDYETGMKIGPLPRAQAYAELRKRGYDIGKKVKHSEVTRNLGKKGLEVAKANKRGGINPNSYFGGGMLSRSKKSKSGSFWGF